MEQELNTAEEQLVEVENVSNESLLKVVTDKLNYSMIKDILVKPLDPIKVKRTINVPVETEELDEDGKKVMSMEMQEVDVDSSFREGIVLALPVQYDGPVTIGAKIAYPHKYSIDFDLFMNSVLVKPFDVIAIVD